MSARVIRVIETDLELRGKGEEKDPIRRIRQYWSLDGELLAEVDPMKGVWEGKISIDQQRDCE